MNDVDYPVSDVLNGIEAAQKAGFTGIKVNMVVKKVQMSMKFCQWPNTFVIVE